LTTLAPVKSRIVHLSDAGLPRLSWKKAVKGCSSSRITDYFNVTDRAVSLVFRQELLNKMTFDLDITLDI